MRAAAFVTHLLFAGAARAGGSLTGGITHVRDGDMTEVNGIAIRLICLHALELGNPGEQRPTRAWAFGMGRMLRATGLRMCGARIRAKNATSLRKEGRK